MSSGAMLHRGETWGLEGTSGVVQDKVRIGIVGCGVAVLHLEGLKNVPRCEVVAIAGLDTERCIELQDKYVVPRRYGDYSEMLADPDIDMVGIAVPNNLHLPVTLAALAAGKHVLVEKPLARNAAEGEQMVAAAKASGKLLGIIFNRRGRHDVQMVKAEVERGHLGQIYHAKASWMRRSGIPGLGSWFTSKELAGGGPLIDLGVHVLDMALWIMGNPRVTAVSAATYAELGPRGKGQWQGGRFRVTEGVKYEVEDFATALIRFDTGATLQLDTAWAGYTRHTDEFVISVMGSLGGAEIHSKDYVDVGTLKFFGDIDTTPVVTEPRLQTRQAHGEAYRWFVDAILDGTPLSPDGEEGLDRVRLIDAIYESARLGHEIMLDEQQKPVATSAR